MLVESNMMALGTIAPDFKLPDTVSDRTMSLSELKGDLATVVVFICNHCPFVHHINSKLVEVAKSYQEKGVEFIAISSNDINSHPEDAPAYMKEVAKKEGYPFPYLFDYTQSVAKAYQAECTPDFFVFNNNLECAYRGRFDETRPGGGQPTGRDLSAALDDLIARDKVTINQMPSMGCSIKWK